MPRPRAELDAMLDELDRDLAMLVMNQTHNVGVWTAFAGQADAICAQAGGDDLAHVKARMDAILRTHGIEPGEPSPGGRSGATPTASL